VNDNTDCDDTSDAVNPGATEICNEIDDDCDEQIDENAPNIFYQDFDGDGFGNPLNSTSACFVPFGYT
jgi:hypothetical protein